MTKSNERAISFRLAIASLLPTRKDHIVEISPYNHTALRAHTRVFGKRDGADAQFALDNGAVTIGVNIQVWMESHRARPVIEEHIARAEDLARQFSGYRVEGSGRIHTLTDLGGFMPKGLRATALWRFPRKRVHLN